ncbi:MAG: nucleotidyl transferase AbiEii/AbiGii toxin family protein [Gottschalkiaceae bacterium]|nr:MAG: nucleotidyl transferase AbiEii/AbiGii toxin family protein [Gottschalkiaceae bacterium]
MTLEEVRKMIIISLFADDEFYERFVLKGGNALLIHNINKRASVDIDVSMSNSFNEQEIEWVRAKLEQTLDETFKRKGHAVIDVTLNKKPKNMPPEKEKFWGGYKLEFKIVSLENKQRLENGEIEKNILRQLALESGDIGKKTFKVDISNYEFCERKVEVEVDGFPIYVYTPIVIIYEKLRAICQQQKEYEEIVKTNLRPRPKDFFDIFTIMEEHGQLNLNIKEEIYQEKNLKDLVEIFSLKKVPLDFLINIEEYREFHREEYAAVKDTVSPDVKIESFDFYFDYTLKLAHNLVDELINLNMMGSTFANA